MRLSPPGRWNSWRCGCRCRRSTNSTTAALSRAAIESGSLAAGDEIVIMPAGKIARIRTVEGWPAHAGQRTRQTAGRSVGITLDRELFVERGDVIAHVGNSPRDTRRHSRADFLAARQAADDGRLDPGPARHPRNPRHRGGDREGGRSRRTCRASRPDRSRATMSAKSIFRWPIRWRPIPIPTIRAPGAGDRGQWPHRRRRTGAVGRCRTTRRSVDIVPVESALRPDERSARYRHSGAVVWLTVCRAPENRHWRARWNADCSAMAARRCCWMATPCAPASTTISASPHRTVPRTFVGWPKSRFISRATGTSPLSPRSRRRGKIVARHAASLIPRSAKSTSPPPPKCARAATPRAITPRRGPGSCTPSPASAMIISRRRNAN